MDRLRAKSSKESLTGEPEANAATEWWHPDDVEGLTEWESDLYFDYSVGILDQLKLVDEGLKFESPLDPVLTGPTDDFLFSQLAHCALDAAKYAPNESLSYRKREDEHMVSSECGDDDIKFTNQPALSIMTSVLCQSLFGMRVSGPDTFLSRVVGNYTEKWILMPRDALDLPSQLKVAGGKRTTPLIDIPALRSALPVGAQIQAEKSSIGGKAALFARSLSYSRGTEDELMCWKASLFQDILLSIATRGGGFPYLPVALGGLGKPVPCGSTRNIERSASAWKRGRYRPMIYTIMAATHHLVSNESDFVPDPFLQRVKEVFSGYEPGFTYLKRSLPLTKGLTPPWAMGYFMGEFSSDAASNAAIRRLRSAGMIVSEKDLIVAAEVEEYVRGLIASGDPVEFHKLRTDAFGEYRREVTRGRSFAQLFREDVGTDLFVYSLDERQKSFAMEMNLDNTHGVSNFLYGEKFFSREALDRIYYRGPSKVHFPLLWRGERIFTDEADEVPEEELIPPDLEDEYRALISWAKGQRNELPPRDLLEDDDIILEEVKRKVFGARWPVYVAIIVTSDLALCDRVNRETTAVVIRLSPKMLFDLERGLITGPRGERFSSREGALEALRRKMRESIPFGPTGDVWIDTGSWAAEGEKQKSFPFVKSEVFDDTRSLYFEWRQEVLPENEAQRAFDLWPLGRGWKFDRMKLLNFTSGQVRGNPITGSDGGWRRGQSLFSARQATKGQARPLSKWVRSISDRISGRMPKDNDAPSEESLKDIFFNGATD